MAAPEKLREEVASAAPLRILLQEDLVIRGGAQLWLTNCGARLSRAGHTVMFLLPADSLILEDVTALAGVTVSTYDRELIAASPADFVGQFTDLLKEADCCVTLVRQKRGGFQNVGFVADCIEKAGLPCYLIAKTGTPDPTYEPSFYGGPLLAKGQCTVVTIAAYTRAFIVENMGVPEDCIINVYNGTDTTRFARTDDMAVEAMKRYPLTKGCFAVGCIGSFEERKGQSVLLKAIAKLKDGGLNVHGLFVGEGPDKEMLLGLIDDLGIKDHATVFDFTKEPFYVFERCDVIALPSVGKEGLPNVLLEALAMEKPCVATRSFGSPEVVIDEQTGYCFPSGDVDALAAALTKIHGLDAEARTKMAATGKDLVFAEHDKVVQFEKILKIIVEKARR